LAAALGGCLDDRILSERAAAGGSARGGRAGRDSLEAGAAGADAGGAASEGGAAGAAGEREIGAGQAGAEAGTAGTTGGSSGSGTGGAAGESGGADGGAGGEGPPRCPDLDGNQVADCEETLVGNGAFDRAVSGWTNEPHVTSSWDSADARGHEDSGSLALEAGEVADRDGDVMLGSRQCLEISPGGVYRFAVEVSLFRELSSLRAGFQLLVHAGSACSGQVLDVSNSSVVDGTTWRTAELAYLSPLRARSITLRLAVIKPYRDGAKVRFDNVLVRAE
jgi:hypothetical protein